MQDATKPQFFSDPGNKKDPFFGKTIVVGQPPKKREKGTEKRNVAPTKAAAISRSHRLPREASRRVRQAPVQALGLDLLLTQTRKCQCQAVCAFFARLFGEKLLS